MKESLVAGTPSVTWTREIGRESFRRTAALFETETQVPMLNLKLRYRSEYDAEGRLTNRWSAAKGNTGYTYDWVGNLTNINYPNSPDVRFQYDGLNRVTNMVDAAGTTVCAVTCWVEKTGMRMVSGVVV